MDVAELLNCRSASYDCSKGEGCHVGPVVSPADMGWTASAKSSGESGLPWKMPDYTGNLCVCQPLKATSDVLACMRLTQR